MLGAGTEQSQLGILLEPAWKFQPFFQWNVPEFPSSKSITEAVRMASQAQPIMEVIVPQYY